MQILLPLAILASVSYGVLTADSAAPAPPAPLTTSPHSNRGPGEELHSRAKRGGKINYRRLARGLHMIRLGKRDPDSSPLDDFDDTVNNEAQLTREQQMDALLSILSAYKNELASLPVEDDSISESLGVSPFDDIDRSFEVSEEDREDGDEDSGLLNDLPYVMNFKQTLPVGSSSLGSSSEQGNEYYDAMEPSEGGMEGKSKRGLSMLRLGKRGLSMLRLGKRDSDGYEKKQDEDMNNVYDVDDKRSMAMLRLGKRTMRMLRLGKRPVSMLRLGKRPMSMLRLGKRPMSMLRLGKRGMSMLRLGKRPMSMLRLGKRPMSMLRLGKRPMSMLRLGKRPMSMLRLGKRSAENEPGQ